MQLQQLPSDIEVLEGPVGFKLVTWFTDHELMTYVFFEDEIVLLKGIETPIVQSAVTEFLRCMVEAMFMLANLKRENPDEFETQMAKLKHHQD